MARSDDKPVSAATRRLRLRMRPDLSIHPQRVGCDRYWVVKDPVALTYFQLLDEEHAILRMLDGRTSLEEIKRRFEQMFAPLQMSVEQIQAFLGRLYRHGLLLAEAAGQGEELLGRRNRRRFRTLTRVWTNLLAIRFRGVDPEPFLCWLYPKCRWLFSAWVVIGCLLLGLGAATLATVQFDVLRTRLPDFRTFFGAGNVVWLAVSLAAAKVLHEMGHALACKHFKGECHEMGLMLLAFTPCLYCNVSDSWMFPNKWQRIAISAAGMYVELLLASVCTFLWWFSEPGLLNTLCLNVMFICSISTVLFNGNPLLRYDGYFILSDLVEVPNLAQQSRALVNRALARFFLGVELYDDRLLPRRRRGLLASYAVASTLYRWTVVIAILWFCHKVLGAYGLELVAWLLTMTVIVGFLVMPIQAAAGFLGNPVWRRRIKRGRAALTLSVLVAAVVAVCLVPLPFHVAAPVVLSPRGVQRVYVPVPGTLVESVAPGVEVRPGQTLARLDNLELRMQIEKLTEQRDQQRLSLKNLELRLVQDPTAGSQIPAAREALADIEERLHERRRDQQRLKLTATAAGTVLPPPGLSPQPYTPGRLQTWWGSPLDRRNLGCYLKTGTLFCLLGDPASLEAVPVIDQADIKFVRSGQRARIRLDELPGKVLEGTITEIARTDLKVAPRELAAGSELLTRVDQRGVSRPLETSYQARVTLDDHDYKLLTGTRGQAKILADPQPLYRRMYRYLRRTFRLGL